MKPLNFGAEMLRIQAAYCLGHGMNDTADRLFNLAREKEREDAQDVAAEIRECALCGELKPDTEPNFLGEPECAACREPDRD